MVRMVGVTILLFFCSCKEDGLPPSLSENSETPHHHDHLKEIAQARNNAKVLAKELATNPNLLSAITNSQNALRGNGKAADKLFGNTISAKSVAPNLDMNYRIENRSYHLSLKVWNPQKMATVAESQSRGVLSSAEYGVALDPGEFYPEYEGQQLHLIVEKNDSTQDTLLLPPSAKEGDSVMTNCDYPLILVKPELTEEEYVQMERERVETLLAWYDSTSGLRQAVCDGSAVNRGGNCGGGGGSGGTGSGTGTLPPGHKLLYLVSFSTDWNNEWGDDEFEIYAASEGDVFPPNAIARFLIGGDGNYTVNRHIATLSPTSNIRINAVEDDCQENRLRHGDHWIEKSFKQVRDFITFAPNPNDITSNFFGARLDIVSISLQVLKNMALEIWDRIRGRHGEISTVEGYTWGFDFKDRTIKRVFDRFSHYGGCWNADDGYGANTFGLTQTNIGRDMINGGGFARTDGGGPRRANFVFKLY